MISKSVFRINRNIVECKVTVSRDIPLNFLCINRNIVECKETCHCLKLLLLLLY